MSKRLIPIIGIGCGLFLLLLITIGIALMLFAPKAIQWAGEQMALEEARQQMISNWQPPSESAEQFFPASINNFELESHDQNASIPALRFDIHGQHAVYHSSKDPIDVYAFEVNELEKEALFERVHDAYEDDQGSLKSMTSLSYRMYYSSSENGIYHIWWAKGWLLVFKTPEDTDQAAFIKAYFRVTTEKSSSETP